MTIVVTGATGHLGRLIVESLLTRGVAAEGIVAGGRQVGKLDDLADRGVTVARIDYSDDASLAAAFSGADTLVLVSGSEVGSRIAQHGSAVAAAHAAGIRRIVYTSAPHADATTLVLAPEHAATEKLIREAGIPFTFLRNGWYSENYLSTLDEAAVTGEIVASVGDGRVASASRVDFAEAAAAAVIGDGHENAVYELTGDVAWDFSELAATASDVLGMSVAYRSVTPQERHALLVAAGLPEGAAQFVVALDGNIRDGVLAHTPGDLARLIGRATTPLAETLAAAPAARIPAAAPSPN